MEEFALEVVIRRLTDNAALNPSDRDAVLGLLQDAEICEAGASIVQQGAPCRRAAVLLEGFAVGEVGWRNQHRQIVTIHLPGDLLDLHGTLTGLSGESIMAVADCKIAAIPADRLTKLMADRPQIASAFWIETLIKASIAREWIMNVGKRNARQRIAHLCCELAWRSHEAGLSDGQTFTMPMTYQQLADATGLTRLHVNHTLRKLQADGLIDRNGAVIRVLNDVRLKEEGDFDALYLRCGATH